jgi:hypothetical protein
MFHDRQNQFASANQQYLASSLLKLWKDGSFSQVINPLHNSINYDSVSKLADQIGADRIVELK